MNINFLLASAEKMFKVSGSGYLLASPSAKREPD
jgi:hypothetical protein